MKVMVTGHRPGRLNGQEKKVRQWLSGMLTVLNPSLAISGMADGADAIFAELAKEKGISLAIALPFKNTALEKYPDLFEYAKEVVYIEDHFDREAYYKRDCAMVDAADIVLAVWDGVPAGGTYNTIKYA